MKLIGIALAFVALLAAACGSTVTTEATTTLTVEAVEAEETTAATTTERPRTSKTFVVSRVIDGDTIELKNGNRVRLVQIDAPETQESECFSQESTEILSAILPQGTKVTLEADPKLDDVDRYDRLLRYVFKDEKNVNLVLVQRGAASVWFYEGDKGRYAKKLLKAAKQARSKGKGLWGACPGTRVDPLHAVTTSTQETETVETQQPPTTEEPPPQNCHPSYTGECLDPSVSDYDCEGGEGNGPGYTGTVTVVGYDEYGLDGDGDGIGCE